MLRNPDTIIDEVYRSDWGRIVASLIRLVNVFDVAEEAVQEAFAAALAQGRSSGVLESPQAWIVQTARHTAIDRIRRRTRFSEKLESYAASGLITAIEEPDHDTSEIPDDRLRLIFTAFIPAERRKEGMVQTQVTAQGCLGSTPKGRRSQIRGWRAGGSLAVASSTPATPLLSPAKIRELNHA